MSLSKFRGKEFSNEILGISLTTYKNEDGVILFVASQVACLLGYKDVDSAIRRHVPRKYRRSLGTGEKTPGETPGVKVPVLKPNSIGITEPGFWSLAFGSKLPVADKLRDWVFEEVLPSIREYGYYALPGVLEAILKIDIDDVKALTDGSHEKKEFRKEAKKRADEAKDKTAMENGSKGGKARWEKSLERKYFDRWVIIIRGRKIWRLQSELDKLNGWLNSDYVSDLSPLSSNGEI